MKVMLSVFYAILLSLFLGTSLAQAQLVIDKGKVNLLIKPGQKLAQTLHLKNTSDDSLTVKIYMEDFVYVSPFEGTKEFFTAGTKDRSNSNWITIAPREVTLPPKGEKDVSYVINVPADVKGGGYNGVIIFENLPSKVSNPLAKKDDQQTAQVGMSFILRIGTLIFLQTEDAIEDPVFDQFAFDGSKLNFKYKNNGNAILITESKHYVMDEEGNVVDRTDGKKKYLPPGESTDMAVELPVDLATGKYTMVVSLSSDGNDLLVKEVDFTKGADGQMTISEVR